MSDINLLGTVDADEVSPVRRGANRKGVVLKGDATVDPEVADMLDTPWAHEGALVDALRKEGTSEAVQKSVVGAMRLLDSASEDLPADISEIIEKLGTEMYARVNRPLNTSGGVSGAGELSGSASGDEDDPPEAAAAGADTTAHVSGADLDGSATSTEDLGKDDLEMADTDDDEDDVAKEGSESAVQHALRVIRKAVLGKAQDEPLAEVDNGGKPEGADIAVEKGGTVADHAPVPVQKEDGSWDFTDVPDEAAAFYRTFITKTEQTETLLKAATDTLASVVEQDRQREVIAKAETLKFVAPVGDLAEILKAARENLDPEMVGKLEDVLKAANARIESSDLFTELGKTHLLGAESPGDAWSQIEKMADELVEKSGAGEAITKDAAVARVLDTEAGKRLYEQHTADQQAAGGVL